MRSPSRFSRWIIISAVLLNGLVMVAMVLSLHRSYRESETRAEVSAQNLLLVLSQKVEDNFAKVDLVLQSLTEVAQRGMGRGGFDPERFNAVIERNLLLLEEIGAMGMADETGRVRAGKNITPQVQLNIADREYFSRLRESPRAGLVVTTPIFTRIGQEWVIPLARRVDRPDGSFAGIVYAHVRLAHLQRLFETLDAGPHGSIGLRDIELGLTVRHPASDAFPLGGKATSSELRAQIEAGEMAGRYKSVQPVDQIERLFVFTKLKGYPYYLVVGSAPVDYLSQWRDDVAQMAVLAALFMGVSIASVWLILRQRAQQQAALDDLQTSEAKLAAILANAGASIYMKDSGYRYLFANRRILTLTEASSPETLTGQTDEQLVDAASVAVLREHDRRVIENGETLQVIERVVSLHGHRAIQVLSVKMPMRRPDGSIYALCGISTDITELIRVQRRENVRSQVLEMLARHEPLLQILDRLVRGIEADEDGLRCAIVLIEGSPKRLRTAAAPNLPDFFNQAIDSKEVGIDVRSCGHAAFAGERIVVEDIQAHPLWTSSREVAAQAGVRSCWAEPIRLSTGEVIGTFAIYHASPKAPQAHEIEFIESAAHLAGIAIERQRQDAELKIAAQVFESSQEAMMVTDAGDCIIAVNQAFTQVTGYARAEAIGATPRLLSSGRHDAAFFRTMQDAFEHTGNWQGELWNRRKNGDLYVAWMSIHTVRGDGLRRISLFSDITERKQTDELAWRHANFDLLTQLPNRRLFFDRLEHDIMHAQRDSSRLALLFIDLDHFKQVNDMQGHAMGDALLVETAQRLSASVSEVDTVARLGGDEFAIILSEFAHPQDIERVAICLVDAMRQPFDLDGQITHITASIGIVVYPDDGLDAHSLLRNADQAMHAAKGQGRNSFSYFTAAMQQDAQERRHLLTDLHGALEKGQFELVYQPIVDLATGRICKTEALLRWRHPQHGLVGPAAFIPLAEESGLIHSIGDWVFREAMHFTQGLIKRTGVPLQTSVNVSPVQFSNETFPAQWMEHLQQNGISGAALVVEITEGILIHHRPEVVRKLEDLRQAGITVAIDDFGTGYSSLSYIKRFDIDVLKIDQSFVRDMASDFSSQALVEAIIVMAHKLGLEVVAEGIETAEQRDLLVALGCDYGQGYFLSRPVSAQAFEQLLLAQP